MRRALASLLLAFWIAGYALPPLAQPDVPACCRAKGKHHCAMHSPADGFHADSGCCPYHQLTAVSSQRITPLPLAAQAIPVILSQSHADSAQPISLRQTQLENFPERSPPSHLN